MELIIHRVNTIEELKAIDSKYGTEIDIRSFGSELVLNHEPYKRGEQLVNYLDEYQNGILVLNIKEAGIEDDVLKLVRERDHIKKYFLLDVEFPYLYRASRLGEKNIAVRFSEDECIETVEKYVDKVDWVWIDTNTRLPISETNCNILNKFNKCLVCPERWGRPGDIIRYKKSLKLIGFEVNAVMTSKFWVQQWMRRDLISH